MRVGWLMAAALVFSAVSIAPVGAQPIQPPAGVSPGRAGDPGGYHLPAAAVEHRPAIADFEGTQIDLSADWGQARACMVWRGRGLLECYRSGEELGARVDQLSMSVASSWQCSSPLRLFGDGGYGGRELWFFDRGYWQNLGDYGFDDQLSSYIVGACYSHLAEYADGGGYWYPGSTSPYSATPYVYSSWNDRVSSIEID